MTTEFIELAGQGQPADALPLRREGRARAQRRRQAGAAAARIALLGVSYKAGVGDMRESPALKIIALLRRARRRPRLPRPARARAARARAAPRAASTRRSTAPTWRVIVTAHPGVDHDAVAERAPLVVDLRGVTRGIAGRSTGAAVSDAPLIGRRRRASATGARTSRATSTRCPAPSCAGAATARRGAASAAPRSSRGARFTADLDDLLADPELDAVVLATPVPTHADARRARARGGQALLRREAARAVRRRRRARRRGAAARRARC